MLMNQSTNPLTPVITSQTTGCAHSMSECNGQEGSRSPARIFSSWSVSVVNEQPVLITSSYETCRTYRLHFIANCLEQNLHYVIYELFLRQNVLRELIKFTIISA